MSRGVVDSMSRVPSRATVGGYYSKASLGTVWFHHKGLIKRFDLWTYGQGHRGCLIGPDVCKLQDWNQMTYNRAFVEVRV